MTPDKAHPCEPGNCNPDYCAVDDYGMTAVPGEEPVNLEECWHERWNTKNRQCLDCGHYVGEG